MATADGSQSLCEGQQWNTWADTVGFKISENEEEEVQDSKNKNEGDTMKLQKEDMSLYGFCPAWDDFFLVVCEVCKQVVKPQALRSHIDQRHSHVFAGRTDHWDLSSRHLKSHSSSGKSWMPCVPGKSTQGTFTSTKSSSSQNSVRSSVQKSNSGHNHSRNTMSVQDSGCHGMAGTTAKTKPEKADMVSKMKKNHSMAPVVRVERITPSLMMRKASHSGNAFPVDKREVPSPQQPPPLLTASRTLGAHPSGPGPGAPCGSSPNVQLGSHALVGSGNSSARNMVPGACITDVPADPPTKKGSSKSKKPPKERKLLPCKDREYDPNKHCGVWVPDTGKHCTRSLTCKTHSLSARRAVQGRKKNFDDLLSDHRAAKEASLKAAQNQANATATASVAQSHSQSTSSSQQLVISSSASAGSSAKGSSGLGGSAASVDRLSTLFAAKSSKGTPKQPPTNIPHCSSRSVPAATGSTSSLRSESSQQSGDQSQQRHQADKLNDQTKNKSFSQDHMYITHHPKPAAVCTFGLRQLGNGLYLIDRRWDLPRAAFRAAVCTERGSHPPPLKKLCVESRLPPVPEPVDPSDPYSFTCMDSVSSSRANSSVPSAMVTTTVGAAPTVVTASASSYQGVIAPTTTAAVAKPMHTSVTSSSVTKPSKPKTISSKPTKPKEGSGNPPGHSSHGSAAADAHHPSKKKRTSASVVSSAGAPMNRIPSVASTLSSLSNSSGTITLTAVQSPHSLPLPFPLTIGEHHLDAFSRFQMASSGLTPNLVHGHASASLHGAAKEGGVVVTTVDMLNGQLPVSSALLHSVTMNRSTSSTPLLTTPSRGLSIPLVGHLSRQPSKGQEGDTLSSEHLGHGSGKSNSVLSTVNDSIMLQNLSSNNSAMCSVRSSGSCAKSKNKTRRTTPSSVSATPISSNHSNISKSVGLGVYIDGPDSNSIFTTVMGNSATNLTPGSNSHSSCQILPNSSSMTSPLIRSDALSPQLPASPPLINGLGLSPPSYTSKGLSGSTSAVGSNYFVSVSPVSSTSSLSPNSDTAISTNTGNATKGKSSSKPNSSSQKNPSAGSNSGNTGISTSGGSSTNSSTIQFPLSSAASINLSDLTMGGALTNTSKSSASHSLTYQQVFASQVLDPAHLGQLQLQEPSKQNSAIAPVSGLSLVSPLRIPVLTTGITTSVTSSHPPRPILMKNEDRRRTEV